MDEKFSEFLDKLRQRKFSGSYDIAHATVQILHDIIAEEQWSNVDELMAIVRRDGEKMIRVNPCESTVGNMVRRVLKIIWEEHTGHHHSDHQESLQKLLLSQNNSANTQEELSVQRLKESVLDGLRELLLDLETSEHNIAEQAFEHIHPTEVILTTGKSRTVEAFLKSAAKKIKFQVIIAERAPFFDGQEMAMNLAKEGIKTTVITDSAVFAMMARVNKVIVGAHTIMANGGVRTVIGTNAIALAAKHYSVPFIVCAAMFKLSTEYYNSYFQHQNAFNTFGSPNNVLQYSEGKILSKVQMYNPIFDYVDDDLITTIVSNIGGNTSSYLLRLLKELYLKEDFNLSGIGLFNE